MTGFKDMLKYYRKNEGLSQAELAKKIGVSTSTISMYEVGNREPDFETEEKIADFFNVDLSTLRGRDTELIASELYKYKEFIEPISKLNDLGRERLREGLKDMLSLKKYTEGD